MLGAWMLRKIAVAALEFLKVCTTFGGAAASVPGPPVTLVTSGPSPKSTSPSST
jgi:hypothetical protein